MDYEEELEERRPEMSEGLAAWDLWARERQGALDYRMGWPQTPPTGISTAHVQAWMKGWVKACEAAWAAMEEAATSASRHTHGDP